MAVFGKHVKRIPQQLIGAGTEGIQMPALLEDFSEFRNLNETVGATALLKRIQADREFHISRFDDDHAVAQVSSKRPFFSRYCRKQIGSQVTVEIETRESASGPNVLLQEETEQRRLAGASLTQYRDMFCAPVIRDRDVAARCLPIVDSET